MDYSALLSIALRAPLRNKIRSLLTVLGITIGIAAVICVVAIGNVGQKRVEQHLNNLGDNFVWIEAGSRAVNGVYTGTHALPTLTVADAIAIKNQLARQIGLVKTMVFTHTASLPCVLACDATGGDVRLNPPPSSVDWKSIFKVRHSAGAAPRNSYL